MRVAAAREQLGDEAAEEVGGGGALRGARAQHAHHERLELLRVVAADGRELALRDLVHQRRQVRACTGRGGGGGGGGGAGAGAGAQEL